MRYDTVIFDLDGTLLNTLEDLMDSVNAGLGQYGYPERTISEVRSDVGNGVRNLISRSIPGGTGNPDYEAVFQAFRAHYAGNFSNKTQPYPGIPELVRDLARAGTKMAVVSNKYDEAVKALTAKFFSQEIPVAIGEQPGVPRKPAPDGVRQALNLLGVREGRAVYIGDSEVDIATAEQSGLDGILVTWGFRPKEELAALTSLPMADTIGELRNLLLDR